jgi:hypothetical protein
LGLSRKQRRSFQQPHSRREGYKVEPGVTPNKKGENTRFPPLKECFGYLEVHSECSLSSTISGVLCGLCADQSAKGLTGYLLLSPVGQSLCDSAHW